MNELEKKSYRYEVLAELARELGYKKERIEDDINRWEDIEDEWSKKEVEKSKIRITVVEAIERELNKM